MPSRSSTRCPRSSAPTTTAAAERADGAVRARSPRKTIRTTTKEAELAKLFTNTWRYMKFAVANQFFMIADQAGVDYTNVLRAIREDYPRAADLPGSGLRRRSVPVQGHDAAGRLHRRPLPARPGRDAGQRGPAGLHRVARSSAATAACRARPSASSAWPSRRESDDTRASLSYKLRKLLSWAGARVLATDPYVDDDRLVPLDCVLAESDVLVLGAPHKAYRGLEIGGKDVVDVWGLLGEGIRL